MSFSVEGLLVNVRALKSCMETVASEEGAQFLIDSLNKMKCPQEVRNIVNEHAQLAKKVYCDPSFSRAWSGQLDANPELSAQRMEQGKARLEKLTNRAVTVLSKTLKSEARNLEEEQIQRAIRAQDI